MKAVVATFNQEKALVGAFSVIVQLHRLIGYNTSPDGGHPLHVLLLLHGLLEDEVVDGEHDDDREPEGEGGGDEGVGHVGHEPAVVVPRGRPLLHRGEQ